MSKPAASPHATFTQGSLAKHVITTTIAGSLGLLAMFAVDFIDVYFIGLLGEPALAAAVGYSATITFFTTSLAIGASIAVGVSIGAAMGQSDLTQATQFLSNSLLITSLVTVPLAATVWWFAQPLLQLIGASGHALDLAVMYLRTVIIGFPLLAIAMCISGALRAQGMAGKATYLTFTAAIVNVILDPLLIFGAGLELQGAALATFCAQIGMAATGMRYIQRSDAPLSKPSIKVAQQTLPAFTKVAVPAVLSNLATPVGNAYLTRYISDFGDDAIAGFAVIGRLTPIAFAFVFALSGAIGPIIGQNYSAQLYQRVRATILESMLVAAAYTLVVTGILMLLEPLIVSAFPLGPEGIKLVDWFCGPVAFLWMFNAWIFIANASYNNLGKPIYSTVANWTRQTLFTIPFAAWFASQMGVVGILIGPAIGGVVVALVANYFAVRLAHQSKVTSLHDKHNEESGVGVVHTDCQSSRFGLHMHFPRIHTWTEKLRHHHQ